LGIRPPLTVNVAELEQAGQLIRRAMIVFESDRRAAWRYLIMASTIFTHDLNIGRSTFPVPEPPSGLARWQTKRVVDYIEHNLESSIDVHELAKLISVSTGHFSRAFKQRVGLPPMAFIATRRVERAKTMLISTRESIANIAAACGFGDQAHLTRRFHCAVGVTPGRYRRINSHLHCADQGDSLQTGGQ
jgi:transcriptional regulator GlxA family with amidase domain